MNNIKGMRESKGITQYQLADLVGVKQASISAWESNKKEPTLATYKKLAEALGCSYIDLIGEDEFLKEYLSLACKKFDMYYLTDQNAFYVSVVNNNSPDKKVMINKIKLKDALVNVMHGVREIVQDLINNDGMPDVEADLEVIEYLDTIGKRINSDIVWYCDILERLKESKQVVSYRVESAKDYSFVLVETDKDNVITPLKVIKALRQKNEANVVNAVSQYLKDGFLTF